MYNSLSTMPFVPYNVLTYLATQEEIIWKLLKYPEYEALDKPDLTFDEKMSMIWKKGPQEDYNVFFTNLVEDAIPESKCIFKCYQYYIQPSELYVSTCIYAFDILFGGQMALVEYQGLPVSRGDLMVQRIVECLNGVSVNGVGRFVFSLDQSRYDLGRSVIGNSKTYTGFQLFMSVLIGDSGKSEGCYA